VGIEPIAKSILRPRIQYVRRAFIELPHKLHVQNWLQIDTIPAWL
jgi:hypothetical protein